MTEANKPKIETEPTLRSRNLTVLVSISLSIKREISPSMDPLADRWASTLKRTLDPTFSSENIAASKKDLF